MGKEQQALNPAAINGTETEEEIDLVEVFYLLWGHILQIIACFLVGALLAFGFTYFFVTPMYQASASIYIVSASNNSIVNLTDLQIGSQLTAAVRCCRMSSKIWTSTPTTAALQGRSASPTPMTPASSK